MDEQDKKTLDVENMSDEELENVSDEDLEEIAAGCRRPPVDPRELREFIANGGTIREFMQQKANK